MFVRDLISKPGHMSLSFATCQCLYKSSYFNLWLWSTDESESPERQTVTVSSDEPAPAESLLKILWVLFPPVEGIKEKRHYCVTWSHFLLAKLQSDSLPLQRYHSEWACNQITSTHRDVDKLHTSFSLHVLSQINMKPHHISKSVQVSCNTARFTADRFSLTSFLTHEPSAVSFSSESRPEKAVNGHSQEVLQSHRDVVQVRSAV